MATLPAARTAGVCRTHRPNRAGAQSPSVNAPPRAPLASLVEAFESWGLGALLVLAPLAFASVQPWAWSVIAAALAAIALAGSARQFRRGGLEVEQAPLLLGAGLAIAVCVAQLVPVPPALVRLLAPESYAVLSAALPAHGAGAWHPLTLDLGGTLEALLCGCAYLLAFLVAARLARRGRGRALLIALVVLGMFETLYGVAEVYHGRGTIFGVATPSDPARASGTYVSPTHFAGLLGMAIPSAIGLAALVGRRGPLPRAWRPRAIALATDPATPQRLLLLFAAAVMAVGLAASLSRGGVLATLVGLVALAASGRRGRRTSNAAWVMAGGAAAAVWLSAIGIERLMARFLAIYDHTWGPSAGMRLVFYRDVLGMIGDFPLLGIGAGAFAGVYPHYQSLPLPGQRLYHAHNDYLEAAVELGVPVFTALILGIGLTWLRAWRSARSPERGRDGAAAVVALCALVPLAVHSLFDFNLRIPANALWASTLLGVGWGAARKRSVRWVRPRTPARRGALAVAVVGGLLLVAGLGALRAVADWTERPFVARASGNDDRPLAMQRAAQDEALALWPWDDGLLARRANRILEDARLDQIRAAQAAAAEVVDRDRDLSATEQGVAEAIAAARLRTQPASLDATLAAMALLREARWLAPADPAHAARLQRAGARLGLGP